MFPKLSLLNCEPFQVRWAHEGRYVIPKRLTDEGFEFRFAELAPALRDLFQDKIRPHWPRDSE